MSSVFNFVLSLFSFLLANKAQIAQVAGEVVAGAAVAAHSASALASVAKTFSDGHASKSSANATGKVVASLDAAAKALDKASAFVGKAAPAVLTPKAK
jgi:ribosomal protein L18